MARPSRKSEPIAWWSAVFLIATPVAAVIAVPWQAATMGVSWANILACGALWIATGLGVTAGYHRLFSHRAWQAPAPIRLLFALLGGAAFENSVIAWSAGHRYHHKNVDTDEDPYNAGRGFWFSHWLWIMIKGAKHEDYDNVPDLWKDPILRWQHRHFLGAAIGTNAVLILGMGLIAGDLVGMMIWAGLVRIVLTHHFTFLINSAAHAWGAQPWSTAHTARDNGLLSLLTFGEGYHNYHHTFASDYRNGVRWYQWDPTKWLIFAMSRMGLAWNLRRSPVDITHKRLFHQSLCRLERRLAAFSLSMDDLRARSLARSEAARERVRQAGQDARLALAERLVAAEKRCEEALAELAQVRASLQKTMAEGRPTEVARRALRRHLRRTTRATRLAVKHWRSLGDAYIAACAATA
jgi:stearoyl-CoA desaturase (delta-9 desaturase)